MTLENGSLLGLLGQIFKCSFYLRYSYTSCSGLPLVLMGISSEPVPSQHCKTHFSPQRGTKPVAALRSQLPAAGRRVTWSHAALSASSVPGSPLCHGHGAALGQYLLSTLCRQLVLWLFFYRKQTKYQSFLRAASLRCME